MKVSVAMKREKTIQYIIHRTWGSHQRGLEPGKRVAEAQKGGLEPRKEGLKPRKEGAEHQKGGLEPLRECWSLGKGLLKPRKGDRSPGKGSPGTRLTYSRMFFVFTAL